jgi:hypothetical protein
LGALTMMKGPQSVARNMTCSSYTHIYIYIVYVYVNIIVLSLVGGRRKEKGKKTEEERRGWLLRWLDSKRITLTAQNSPQKSPN